MEVARDCGNMAVLRQKTTSRIVFRSRFPDSWLFSVANHALATWVAPLPLSIKYPSEENRNRSLMTRKEWQKKKKKMSGREGPKKGKNR